MAFVRRKGNTYYLVHNVRRQGKVQQLHLARLGERPRITDDVVRSVQEAAADVRHFSERVVGEKNELEKYVRNLNALRPQIAWWWDVAQPALQWMWKDYAGARN